MGDVVRLVEEAQSREAPVQRLADKVSSITFGIFCYDGVQCFWGSWDKQALA